MSDLTQNTSLLSYLRTLDTDGVVGVNFAKAKSSRNYYTVWLGCSSHGPMDFYVTVNTRYT